jgi:hypothetical protein
MGLAPSRNDENPGKSAVAKVPAPIFSQPRRVSKIIDVESVTKMDGIIGCDRPSRVDWGAAGLLPGYVDRVKFQNFTTGRSFAAARNRCCPIRLVGGRPASSGCRPHLMFPVAQNFRQLRVGALGGLAFDRGPPVNDETADAVWGNVGSIVAFQVGSDDAEMIAQQLGKFAGQIMPENLSGLPKYTAYARLLIDGMPSNPFSLQTLPPRAEAFDPERAEIIRRVMRRRFASDISVCWVIFWSKNRVVDGFLEF